jgi:hypothetical protein
VPGKAESTFANFAATLFSGAPSQVSLRIAAPPFGEGIAQRLFS